MEEECNVCLNKHYLYPLECVHKFCLECIKGCCITSGACPYCRQTFSDGYKNSIMTNPGGILNLGDVIDGQINALFDKYTEGLWVYEGRRYGWWIYNDIIQEELQKTDADTVQTSVCGQLITIHLEEEFQRANGSHAVRKIRKVQRTDHIILNGIAGMEKTRD